MVTGLSAMWVGMLSSLSGQNPLHRCSFLERHVMEQNNNKAVRKKKGKNKKTVPTAAVGAPNDILSDLLFPAAVLV